jgi:hypothetical protein
MALLLWHIMKCNNAHACCSFAAVVAAASRFKGVAGTHSIVSVTIEELAGRTFPTTIRKGKGEQLVAGKGLEYIIYLLPVDRCRDLLRGEGLMVAAQMDQMPDFQIDI